MSHDDFNFGSELEKFILSHETLKPGDKLEGKVVQVKPDGKLLIQFGKFRAVAESKFPMREGEILHVVVTSKKPKLKLRLETPQLNISPGARQEIRNLEMEPEHRWSHIRAALQKLLDIRDESLFPPGIREALTESDNKIKFKIFSPEPLHMSILVDTERLARIRIDFFLVTKEKNLNITFYVENNAVKEDIASHLAEVEENLKNRFYRLVLNVIVSERKISEFASENLDIDLVNRKILDLKA